MFLLGEVPSTVSQRVSGKMVYVNKATCTENSAMDHATKQHLHVIDLFIVELFLSRYVLCSVVTVHVHRER